MALTPREYVERKVRETWPESFDQVMGLLDTMDVHGGGDEVLARVQLAVLKVSEGNRDRIAGLVDAEYPEQMRWGFVNLADLDPTERKAHREAVRQDREN